MLRITKPIQKINHRLVLAVSLALFFILPLLVFATNPAKVSALSGSDFNAGRIIDDAVFYNGGAMSASQIQQFLNSKVPTCDTNGTQAYNGTTRAAYGASRGYPAPYTCLKNYTESIAGVTNGGSDLCTGSIGGGTKSSAQIIYDVAQACGVSPQVLIVLLQKEQSLITDDWPWSIQYRSATGYGCPDTAPCDSEYYGFFNQVYQAAKAYKRYRANSTNYNYRAGRNNTILWNPNSGCGTSDVYIQNQATAGLYIYTPYRPNQAALNNLYSTGDSCSSYGNRNFWRMFNDWFGSTLSDRLDLRNSLGSNQLTGNATMEVGDFIISPNGRFVLVMQSDGNLVMYSGKKAVWSSGTANNYGAYAKFQTDGNLVIYNLSNVALWASNTNGSSADKVELKDNGNFYIYAGSSQKYFTNIKVSQYAQVNEGSVLNSSTTLSSNHYIQSPDGVYSLVMQGDGNLVLYAVGGGPLWHSNTYGNSGAYAVMQGDGNLVVYNSGGKALWSSRTFGNGQSTLKLQNDGNLAIFKYGTSSLTWNTGTWTNAYNVATSLGDQISSGTRINRSDYLRSTDYRYRLVMQNDGNLVLYSVNAYRALWASNTYGNPGAFAVIQNDGNLAVFSASGRLLWAANSYGNGQSTLKLQNDGNLAIFKYGTSTLTWHTKTYNQF